MKDDLRLRFFIVLFAFTALPVCNALSQTHHLTRNEGVPGCLPKDVSGLTSHSEGVKPLTYNGLHLMINCIR